MSARNALLATLKILKDCLGDTALIDMAPSGANNQRAAMLRQGLAVLIFSTIETFIRERTGEVLGQLTNKQLKFSDLSPDLQRATTLGAIEGLRFRLKLQAPADKVPWLVTNLSPVASAMQSIHQLSTFSFGYAASNLVEDDVHEILKAFGVDSPWMQMTQLTHRVGLALPSCKTEFQAIKRRRHASAHALTSQVPQSDLMNSLRSSLAMCLTFDLLLSHCLGMHNLKKVPNVGSTASIKNSDINLVFVQPHLTTKKFGLRREQLPPPSPVLSRPTVRVFAAEDMAVIYGKQYVSKRKSHLVVLDSTFTPTKWITW